MDKTRILIQLDTDPHPSVFDRVVAVDAGADHVFAYGGVKPEHVQPLVHGAIFTRHTRDLNRTAFFVGGSDVDLGERVLNEIRKTLLPKYGLTVSVLLDSNGANTTAAAAVRAAGRHLDLNNATSLVLGGTGPVGRRVARILARHGGRVRIGSRQLDRAQAACASIREAVPEARIEPVSTASSSDGPKALADCNLVVASGAAGALLLPKKIRDTCKTLRVAIDLNAVPPAGIEGVEFNDKATERDSVVCYGAIGVGDTKMKIHKALIGQLFERNDRIFDVEEVYEQALLL
jgi:hypothetical protein